MISSRHLRQILALARQDQVVDVDVYLAFEVCLKKQEVSLQELARTHMVARSLCAVF